jgi:hypothetical protein
MLELSGSIRLFLVRVATFYQISAAFSVEAGLALQPKT